MPVRSIHIKTSLPHPHPHPLHPAPLPSHSPRPGMATTRWRPTFFQESFTFVPSRGSLFTKAWTNSSGPMCLSRSCTGREKSQKRGKVWGGGTRRGGSKCGRNVPTSLHCFSRGPFGLCTYTEPRVFGARSAHSLFRERRRAYLYFWKGQPPLPPTPRHVGPQWEISLAWEEHTVNDVITEFEPNSSVLSLDYDVGTSRPPVPPPRM